MRQKFITKCDKSLLQNTTGFLLQNATALLQNATVIKNCDDFITKCNNYYKMRRLLQIATGHLSKQIRCNVDILLVSETKIDDSFLQGQSLIDDFIAPYRINCNCLGNDPTSFVKTRRKFLY